MNRKQNSMINEIIQQGKVEIDYQRSSLLVNYVVETVELNESGGVKKVLELRPEVRRIKIKSLSPDKNMAQLAADIVNNCEYLHSSRVEEIEQLLIKLRKQVSANPQPNTNELAPKENGHIQDGINTKRELKSTNNPSAGFIEDRTKSNGKNEKNQKAASFIDSLPPANVNELDEYLDMLYQITGKTEKERDEGLKKQELGTAMILKLCRDVMNLEQLIQNSTVMGALTRVFQEEYKKSADLTFNILRIFLAFSNFMEMHSLMSSYRIGVLTMKAIEFEIKRSEHRELEHAEREAEFSRQLIEAKTDLLTYPSTAEKLRTRREKDQTKHKLFSRKQDKILFAGFYILLNLAEDIVVEKKMIRKGLLLSLDAMLTRSFEDLLILCVTFIKKLSVIDENKDTIKDMKMVDKLVRFIPCSSQPLITITLRLLFNISFDKDIRDQMLKAGLVPKLINLLKTAAFRAKTLKLLYHLSVDDRCKSMFTYTDGIPILMGMVINFPQDYLTKELGALMVNISHNSRNVEMMISNKGLNLLMDRLADKRDVMLMKIVRNISLWSFNQQQELESPELNYKYRGLWSPHIKVILELMREIDSHDVLVELIGTMANLTIYDLPVNSSWTKILKEQNLINLFCKLLVPGMAQNDLLLEMVMLIATMASDPQACALFASSTLIGLLYQLWKEKMDDIELLVQLIHCFHKFFLNDTAREEAMYSTRIMVDIMECLGNRNQAVRMKAERITDIVLEFDRDVNGQPKELGRDIIKRRFESYNKVWLQNNDLWSSNPNGGGGLALINSSTHGGSGLISLSGLDRAERSRASSQEEELSVLSVQNGPKYFNEKFESSMEWRLDTKVHGDVVNPGNGSTSNRRMTNEANSYQQNLEYRNAYVDELSTNSSSKGINRMSSHK